MRLYIDCEFNDPTDKLISLALVSEDNEKKFYEVVEHNPAECEEWVQEHVIPILGQDAISFEDMQKKLLKFLKQFPSVTIVCNHPNDVKYFTEAVQYENGRWFYFDMFFEIRTNLSSKKAKIPHNALSDAEATRDSSETFLEFE